MIATSSRHPAGRAQVAAGGGSTGLASTDQGQGGRSSQAIRAGIPSRIEGKDIAQQSLKLGYDRKTGFLGTSIKSDKPLLSVSEYDLVLGISNDGSYRIMTAPEKVLFTGRLIHCAVFDPERGANVWEYFFEPVMGMSYPELQEHQAREGWPVHRFTFNEILGHHLHEPDRLPRKAEIAPHPSESSGEISYAAGQRNA